MSSADESSCAPCVKTRQHKLPFAIPLLEPKSQSVETVSKVLKASLKLVHSSKESKTIHSHLKATQNDKELSQTFSKNIVLYHKVL